MESVVELNVPATTSHVSLIRSATAAICAQADFTIDRLEDVQLAVDEACALLIDEAPTDAHLTVKWQVNGQQVGIELICPSSKGRPVPKNTFAWTVLTALVDRVESDLRDDGLHISLLAHGIETTV